MSHRSAGCTVERVTILGLRRWGVRSMAAVVILLASCVGPAATAPGSTGSGSASTAPASAASPPPSVSPSPSRAARHGIGISRAAVIAAVDAEMGPGFWVWGPERVGKDGSVSVVGAPPGGHVDRNVTLEGPAGELTGIVVYGPPIESIGDARLPLAILRASVPSAEAWFTASFGQPNGPQASTFGTLTVAWIRHDVMYESHLSALFIVGDPIPGVPMPIPTPTLRPAPS